MKRVYIVNPTSGDKKSDNIMNSVKQVCDKKEYDYEIISTKNPKHAIEIAENYSDGNNVIFSVGGDGTLNEVINGLKDNSNLSIIPCGSGNDFYKSINENTNKIDLGQVNDRYFINIASLGIDANVAYLANRLKDKGSSNPYIKAIVKAISEYSSLDTNLGLFTLIAVCNGSYYGNGFCMAPFADINDGYLDLCTVDDINRLRIINMFLKLSKQKHIYSKTFNSKLIEDIDILSKNFLKCNVDGEIIESDEFNFKVADKRLNYYHEEDGDLKKIIRNLKI